MEKAREFHLQQKKGRRLILFPYPVQGHINPMIQLANILYARGFSITIVHTGFNSPNPANYPHFTFHPIQDGLTEPEASLEDILSTLSILNVKCIRPFQDCLLKLLSDGLENHEPVACLITDAVWYFTQAVADDLKLPRIVIRTSSVFSFLAFAAFPLLRDKGYLPIQDSQSQEIVRELPPLKIKDIPIITSSDTETIYRFIAGMVNQTKASSGLIWNSFEELEKDALIKLRQDFPIPTFTIGPLHKYFPGSSSSLLMQDQTCISWLDTQTPNSVLYVSFGSLAEVTKTEFQEIAWGLANSNQPFLWVLRPGLVRGSEWLEPLPVGFLEMVHKRGHIVKWAPQQEVLAHPATGGFWTHGGWNSTLESICEGVPMICQPNFGDQLVNARYVTDVWRIGLYLEKKLERREIEKVIKRLMAESEGKAIRERIMDLKKQVDLCLSQKGSSFQSLESLISYILSF